MKSTFRSVLSLLLGLALTLFGVIHAVNTCPGPDVFARLADSLPTLGAALLFVLGVAAAVAGLIILGLSARRLRSRSPSVDYRRLTVAYPHAASAAAAAAMASNDPFDARSRHPRRHDPYDFGGNAEDAPEWGAIYR